MLLIRLMRLVDLERLCAGEPWGERGREPFDDLEGSKNPGLTALEFDCSEGLVNVISPCHGFINEHTGADRLVYQGYYCLAQV